MSACPRCQQPLEDGQLDSLTFRLCRGCRGMLLAHPDLMQVLEKSWRAIPEERAEATDFQAPAGWQQEPTWRCPDCRQSMEKYGYMGLAAVLIDRCDRCAVVWLDADELQNMVLALAKSNYRGVRFRKVTEFSPLAGGLVPPVNQAGAGWLFGPGDAADGAVLGARLLQLLLR